MRLSLTPAPIIRHKEGRIRKEREFTPNGSQNPPNQVRPDSISREVIEESSPNQFTDDGDEQELLPNGIPVDDLRFLHAALRVWEIRNGVTD